MARKSTKKAAKPAATRNLRILVVNDDGVNAPGIKTNAADLEELARGTSPNAFLAGKDHREHGAAQLLHLEVHERGDGRFSQRLAAHDNAALRVVP